MTEHEIKQIADMMTNQLHGVEDRLSANVEVLRKEMKLSIETLREEINLTRETLREEMNLTSETLLRGVNIIVENKYDQILKLLREDYGRVAVAVEKTADYDTIKATVAIHNEALEQQNTRIIALEQRAVV